MLSNQGSAKAEPLKELTHPKRAGALVALELSFADLLQLCAKTDKCIPLPLSSTSEVVAFLGILLQVHH